MALYSISSVQHHRFSVKQTVSFSKPWPTDGKAPALEETWAVSCPCPAQCKAPGCRSSPPQPSCQTPGQPWSQISHCPSYRCTALEPWQGRSDHGEPVLARAAFASPVGGLQRPPHRLPQVCCWWECCLGWPALSRTWQEKLLDLRQQLDMINCLALEQEFYKTPRWWLYTNLSVVLHTIFLSLWGFLKMWTEVDFSVGSADGCVLRCSSPPWMASSPWGGGGGGGRTASGDGICLNYGNTAMDDCVITLMYKEPSVSRLLRQTWPELSVSGQLEMKAGELQRQLVEEEVGQLAAS